MMTDRYLSKYSNGKQVSEAQYITELICENKAQRDKTDLHYRFWTTPKWSLFYRNQIGSANQILLKYEGKCIIKALRSPEGQKIFSFRAPHLPALIETYRLIIQEENHDLTIELNRKENKSFRSTDKITIITALRNIDNDS